MTTFPYPISVSIIDTTANSILNTIAAQLNLDIGPAMGGITSSPFDGYAVKSKIPDDPANILLTNQLDFPCLFLSRKEMTFEKVSLQLEEIRTVWRLIWVLPALSQEYQRQRALPFLQLAAKSILKRLNKSNPWGNTIIQKVAFGRLEGTEADGSLIVYHSLELEIITGETVSRTDGSQSYPWNGFYISENTDGYMVTDGYVI